MDAVRRIAGQRKAVSDVGTRQMKSQRVGPAGAHDFDRPEMVAEAAHHFRLELPRRKLQQRRRKVFALGPDQRRAIARHRQDGKWAGRQEVLVGRAVVRPLVMHGRHDSGLRIGPGDDANAYFLAQRRGSAVGGDDHIRAQSLAVRQLGFDVFGMDDDGRDGGRRKHFDAGCLLDGRKKRRPDMAVLDDSAHRLADLAMIEVQRERTRRGTGRGIGDEDVENRLRLAGQVFPHAQRLEHANDGIGESAHPAVERRIQHRGAAQGIDDGRLKPALRERQRERQPDHAAAGDQDIAMAEGARVRARGIFLGR